MVGAALLPASLLNDASERLGSFGGAHVRPLVGGRVAAPLLYLILYLYPPSALYSGGVGVVVVMYGALGYFSALWVRYLLLDSY